MVQTNSRPVQADLGMVQAGSRISCSCSARFSTASTPFFADLDGLLCHLVGLVFVIFSLQFIDFGLPQLVWC